MGGLTPDGVSQDLHHRVGHQATLGPRVQRAAHRPLHRTHERLDLPTRAVAQAFEVPIGHLQTVHPAQRPVTPFPCGLDHTHHAPLGAACVHPLRIVSRVRVEQVQPNRSQRSIDQRVGLRLVVARPPTHRHRRGQATIAIAIGYANKNEWNVSARILSHYLKESSTDKEEGALLKLRGRQLEAALRPSVEADIHRRARTHNADCCMKKTKYSTGGRFNLELTKSGHGSDMYYGLHHVRITWVARVEIGPGPRRLNAYGCCVIPYKVTGIQYVMRDRFDFNPGQFKKWPLKMINDAGVRNGVPFNIEFFDKGIHLLRGKIIRCEGLARV